MHDELCLQIRQRVLFCDCKIAKNGKPLTCNSAVPNARTRPHTALVWHRRATEIAS